MEEPMVAATLIKENMEVLGSDGMHIGVVDQLADHDVCEAYSRPSGRSRRAPRNSALVGQARGDENPPQSARRPGEGTLEKCGLYKTPIEV